MEKYNPLFGEPLESPPIDNFFNFKIKHNRIQYPQIHIEIDDIDINNLPPYIRYYGKFLNDPYSEYLIIVFRYYQYLLFHRRDYQSDGQNHFYWECIHWITHVFNKINNKDSMLPVTGADFDRDIHGHRHTLISIAGSRIGREGFWLRDYDGVHQMAIAIGETDKNDIFVEQYLSNYGLFMQGGLEVLNRAAADTSPLMILDVPL